MNNTHLEEVFGQAFSSSQDNWKGLCPFHDERTPSFYVHKTEYIGHCFGCGIGGDIDTLASKATGLSRSDCRRLLDITATEKLQNAKKRALEKDKQRLIPESWLAPFKKEVHKYVTERGFTLETLTRAGALYDAHTKRQVFPHRNRDGELVGAVGRACTGQDPKWKFYWGYNKGCTLWRPVETPREQTLLVVEGVFDALWLTQHGYTNTAAPIGASLTNRQIVEARSLSTDIIIGFDNDDAGWAGAERAAKALGPVCTTRFINWPKWANDWMDLDGPQIDILLANPINNVQRQLIRNTKASS